MNIHQLLSVSQSSPQTQSQGAFSRQDSANGLFHQTLLQASDTQRLPVPALSQASASQAPLPQAQFNALGTLLSHEVDVENLSAALETLRLDVSESDLSELLAQLQLPNSDINADTPELNGEEASTPLAEIAGRLALMASFSDSKTSLKAEQLTDSDSLRLISEQLDIRTNYPEQPIDPAALKAIAEQLGITQPEAAQLVDTTALEAIGQQLSVNKNGATQPIDSGALEAPAGQLNITQPEAAKLVDTTALKAIAQHLSINRSGLLQPIDPAALKAIAEQLGITQPEAAQLVDTTALEAIGQQLSVNKNGATQPIDSGALEAPAGQLNITQPEAAKLVDTTALKAIAQHLSINRSGLLQPIDPAALKAIAEQLGITQPEAAQLVDTTALEAIGQQLSVNKNGATQPIDSGALEAPAGQLNITQPEAAKLVDTTALKAITQQLSMNTSGSAQPIDSATLEALAEQLNIDQTEAAQLVSALNTVVVQQQGAQSLPINTANLANARSPALELQTATRPQPDNFIAQVNTTAATPQINPVGAASQISSEALIGALLTSEASSKGNPTSEHLITGFSLSNSGSLTQSSQGQNFAPTVTPTPATLSTPLTNPAWPQQLSQQLVQISQRGGEQHVQMQLNPAELGPLSISLKFGEQGAQAHFLSAHAQVRQVLEQAIPQLREALAEQGISLGETSVGEQGDPNAQAFAQSGGKQGTGSGSDNGGIDSGEVPAQRTESSSLLLDGRVDLYA
ncbi:flagellar hook-length control protein FliK [Halomonas sp. AOP13-D3-9]